LNTIITTILFQFVIIVGGENKHSSMAILAMWARLKAFQGPTK
jgi:hypothetical protein